MTSPVPTWCRPHPRVPVLYSTCDGCPAAPRSAVVSAHRAALGILVKRSRRRRATWACALVPSSRGCTSGHAPGPEQNPAPTEAGAWRPPGPAAGLWPGPRSGAPPCPGWPPARSRPAACHAAPFAPAPLGRLARVQACMSCGIYHNKTMTGLSDVVMQ